MPAGKEIEVRFCEVWRFKVGKAKSLHNYVDYLTAMAQLGLIPAPEGAGAWQDFPGGPDYGSRASLRVENIDKGSSMSAEENKAGAKDATKKHNKGDLNGYLAHYSKDLVTHGLPPKLPANLDGLRAFYGATGAAFPDARVEARDMVAEGGKVAVRATHRGGFMGIPPTNNEVSMGIMYILRFRDGRIVERCSNADTMGLMQQLEAIPEPEAAGA